MTESLWFIATILVPKYYVAATAFSIYRYSKQLFRSLFWKENFWLAAYIAMFIVRNHPRYG
jgi:hypothetical protein